ncbi:unnamed protein product [Linum tenue]|uniref:Uncharacterized protein n=1 Tax=Linum tenue TaxID=586396 RepID=A0AAV0NKD1_9ROSI|nr:unnamed protein product [Linum tenue]
MEGVQFGLQQPFSARRTASATPSPPAAASSPPRRATKSAATLTLAPPPPPALPSTAAVNPTAAGSGAPTHPPLPVPLRTRRPYLQPRSFPWDRLRSSSEASRSR